LITDAYEVDVEPRIYKSPCAQAPATKVYQKPPVETLGAFDVLGWGTNRLQRQVSAIRTASDSVSEILPERPIEKWGAS